MSILKRDKETGEFCIMEYYPNSGTYSKESIDQYSSAQFPRLMIRPSEGICATGYLSGEPGIAKTGRYPIVNDSPEYVECKVSYVLLWPEKDQGKTVVDVSEIRRMVDALGFEMVPKP